ncbi:unnamed protein product, partial [Rotaria magnacalcarata]
SPYFQSSFTSQIPTRQRSPSSHVSRQSRSPSPYSSGGQSSLGPASSLRPCYSAPRLHLSHHRLQTNCSKQTDILIEETSLLSSVQIREKSLMGIQRQDVVSSINEFAEPSVFPYEKLSAAKKRQMLKATSTESCGHKWLKRSNSS